MIKKILVGLTTGLFVFVVGTSAAGYWDEVFNSNKNVTEKLQPNCRIRNDYNVVTKKYTKNEVCYPRVVKTPIKVPVQNNNNNRVVKKNTRIPNQQYQPYYYSTYYQPATSQKYYSYQQPRQQPSQPRYSYPINYSENYADTAYREDVYEEGMYEENYDEENYESFYDDFTEEFSEGWQELGETWDEWSDWGDYGYESEDVYGGGTEYASYDDETYGYANEDVYGDYANYESEVGYADEDIGYEYDTAYDYSDYGYTDEDVGDSAYNETSSYFEDGYGTEDYSYE